MRVTSYGWLMDSNGNAFPPEYASMEDYKAKLTADYVAKMTKGLAENPAGWQHANCDHAYGICGG